MIRQTVIVPAFNEAEYVEWSLKHIFESVKDPKGLEIILLDDQSGDGTASVAESVPGVRVIRKHERSGVAASRNIGLGLAKAEIVSHLDAHTWPRDGALDMLREGAESHPDCIIGGANTIADVRAHKAGPDWRTAIQKGLDGKFACNRAHSLTFAVDRWWFYLSVERHLKVPFTRRTACQANGLTATRTLLNRMRGWWNLPGMWSGNDQGMAVKAWFMDVPVLAEVRADIIHAQKSVVSHGTPGWQQVLNRAYVAKAIASDESFKTFWQPGLKEHGGWNAKMDEALDSPVAQAEREWFQTVKVKSEAEFTKTFVEPRIKKAQEKREAAKA